VNLLVFAKGLEDADRGDGDALRLIDPAKNQAAANGSEVTPAVPCGLTFVPTNLAQTH
jgi:hypothetical protein